MPPLAALPRYAEIRRELESAILSGRWRPGHRVPSEHELVEQYGCSRMTVNKALSALGEAGLIVRRRRAGSFVAAPLAQESILEIRDIEAEIQNAGKPYRFELRSRAERKAAKRDAERLGVDVDTPVLAMSCLHIAAGVPLVLEDRLISLAAVPDARRADFHDKPPGSWLLARVPWSKGEHHIRAVNAGPDVAKALGIRRSAACLVVERTTWHNGAPITHVVLSYPGDRHQLVALFSPSSAARA